MAPRAARRHDPQRRREGQDVRASRSDPRHRAAYGYGWGVLHTKDGRVAWHNGGNDWSFASYSRILRDGTMVFWVTNQASQADQWNLEDSELEMNQALADHARDTD